MFLKRKPVILAAVAVVGFGVSFAVFRLTTGKAKTPPSNPAASATAAPTTMPASPGEAKLAELNDLIKQVRKRLQEGQQKERQLEEREAHLLLAQESLKKQTQELEDLRVQLVAPLTTLNEALDRLEKTRIRIRKEDQVNLKKTALIYEKMDSTSGSRILAGMCAQQHDEEAARILYYMSERSAAKILGEFEDKLLAARLSEQMKRIAEEG